MRTSQQMSSKRYFKLRYNDVVPPRKRKPKYNGDAVIEDRFMTAYKADPNVPIRRLLMALIKTEYGDGQLDEESHYSRLFKRIRAKLT